MVRSVVVRSMFYDPMTPSPNKKRRSCSWQYLWRMSTQWVKRVMGSHVESLAASYPTHLTRKFIFLRRNLCPRIASTSYSSCPSTMSGPGGAKERRPRYSGDDLYGLNRST